MWRALVAVLLVVGLGGAVAPDVAAEIEGLQLEVDGLSCPFCAIGLNKNLKKRAGLQDIEIHLKEGVTEAKLLRGQGIDVGKIRRGIQEAGFTLRGITLTVIGHVVRDEEHFAVTSRDDGTRFLLFDKAHEDADPEVVLDEALQEQFEQAADRQQLVKVSGRVHEHEGLPAALMVASLERLSE